MISQVVSYQSPRDVRPLKLTADQVDAALVADLPKLGVGLPAHVVQDMMESAAAIGMDALQPTVTTGNLGTPVQFLQNWLPGFVYVITAARKIDELAGIMVAGSWEDEEVVQGIMELTGTSVPYGDLTNVPLASWNTNYEKRTVVRFEEGLFVGRLEEARAARQNVNSATSKRQSAALALEIQRNAIGFYGFNDGDGNTYGYLNDPNLPNYVSSPNGSWASATYAQIQAALQAGYAALRTKSQDVIDPETTQITLAIASNRVDYLGVTTDYGYSVRKWIRDTYPNTRIVSAPELNGANGGANVWYMYAESVAGADDSTDGGRTLIQVVPTKFQSLGVQPMTKGYEEDYSNATAGVFWKRPWAMVRYTGI